MRPGQNQQPHDALVGDVVFVPEHLTNFASVLLGCNIVSRLAIQGDSSHQAVLQLLFTC
jgi:hypothetical protein